jgi:nitroreductase
MIAINDLLVRRYAESTSLPSAAGDLGDLGPVIESLLSHRSVRHYLDREVDPAVLQAMIAAAQSASTSSNLQAWSVVAVTDAARRERFAHLVGDQKHVARCPLFLVWLADLSRLERVAARHASDPITLDYLEMFLIAVVDAALAAQNAAVAAESLGLGTCYIGGIRNHPEDVAAELKLPPLVMPVFGLTVGWPDEERAGQVRPRLAQSAVLHHETYSPGDEPAAIDRYDLVMAKFYADNRMKGSDWTSHTAQRVSKMSGLSGRERLRQAVESFGFKLR